MNKFNIGDDVFLDLSIVHPEYPKPAILEGKIYSIKIYDGINSYLITTTKDYHLWRIGSQWQTSNHTPKCLLQFTHKTNNKNKIKDFLNEDEST